MRLMPNLQLPKPAKWRWSTSAETKGRFRLNAPQIEQAGRAGAGFSLLWQELGYLPLQNNINGRRLLLCAR